MTKLETALQFSKIGLGVICLILLSQFIPKKVDQKLGAGLYTPVYTNTYFSQTSASTSVGTLIVGGAGNLHAVTFGKPIPGSIITLYDSASSTVQIGTTTVIASITVPTAPTSTPFTLTFDTNYANGLVVDQTGATSSMTFATQ